MSTFITSHPGALRKPSNADDRPIAKRIVAPTILVFWSETIADGLSLLRAALGTLFDAMRESRRKQAHRLIARYVALQGDHMTDEVERELMRRLQAWD
jgi:hypothetical protein